MTDLVFKEIGSLGMVAYSAGKVVAEIYYSSKGPKPAWEWHFTVSVPREHSKGSAHDREYAKQMVKNAWSKISATE